LSGRSCDCSNTSRGAVQLGLAQALASARQTVAMRLVDQVDGDTEAGAELVAKEAEVDIEAARRIVAGGRVARDRERRRTRIETPGMTPDGSAGHER
jgi:electron transfer flavoprotein alpha subunit